MAGKHLSTNHSSLFFYAFRLLAVVCTIALTALAATYLNALVMSGIDANKSIAIVLVLFFSIASLYGLVSLCFFCGSTTSGRRFLYFAIMDLVLAIVFVLAATKLGLDVSAISCQEGQFVMGNLNRYGMGDSNSGSSLLSWAKASVNTCNHAKAAFAMSILLGIVFTITTIILGYIYKKGYRVPKSASDPEK